MPYRSEKQRRFMHAKHPGIAARWDAEYGGKVVPKKKRKVSKADKKQPKLVFRIVPTTKQERRAERVGNAAGNAAGGAALSGGLTYALNARNAGKGKAALIAGGVGGGIGGAIGAAKKPSRVKYQIAVAKRDPFGVEEHIAKSRASALRMGAVNVTRAAAPKAERAIPDRGAFQRVRAASTPETATSVRSAPRAKLVSPGGAIPTATRRKAKVSPTGRRSSSGNRRVLRRVGMGAAAGGGAGIGFAGGSA